ncbi:MAG: PAS domain S-box protein [Alphaproteobacteria bacterium]|nr:PAS domain S-box protein [Alphaproteobacteria bacterium]
MALERSRAQSRAKAAPAAVATRSPTKPLEGDLLYRALFEHAEIGMFQSTPAGKYLHVNPALARLLGYRSPAALIQATVHIGQHYADPARREEMARRLAEVGHVEGFVAEYRRCDGGTGWASVSATAVRDSSGSTLSFIGTVVDVGDLVAAQDALQESAAHLQRIFDNASEGMYRSTPDGRQLRANRALVRLNGYDTEAELLAAVNDIAAEWYVEPGRRDEFKRLLDRAGKVTDFESEIYRHKSRERIWVLENAWLVRDAAGRPSFYEGTVVDITERKRARLALQESERRFRDLAETASDWFWETGPDHRFTYVPDLTAVYGVAATDRIGRTRQEIAIDAEDDPERWARHQESLDRRETFRDFVYRTRLADGRVIHVSVSGKPVYGDDGRFLGYRGSAREVTEAVLSEQRLRKAMLDAEAASQAKVAFLANVSHELRTPLNAILGFAEVIRDRVLGPDDPRYGQYAGFICESGQHLLNVISDILDMAKVEAGGLELFESDVDLGGMVLRQAALMQQRAQDRGLVLECEADRTLPSVRADEVRLRQIMLNLLSNAIKFTRPGGKVTLRAALAADGRPTVVVADTGCGMDAEEVALALEPFRQIDADIARRHEGTGLGLPITKSLVELHGGELRIDSVKGRGTEVTVLLPAHRVITQARLTL